MGTERSPARLSLEAATKVVEGAGLSSKWELWTSENFEGTRTKGVDVWRLVLLGTATASEVTVEAESIDDVCTRALSAERRRDRAARHGKKVARRAKEREARAEQPVDRRVARAFRSHTRGWTKRARKRAWARVRWCVDAADVVETLEGLVAERTETRMRNAEARTRMGDMMRAAGFVRSPSGAKIAVRNGAHLTDNVKSLLHRLGLSDVVERAERRPTMADGAIATDDVETSEG